MSWLQDPINKTLTGALDGLALRETLIAGNLANIDTPGYAPRSISFEGELQAALAASGVAPDPSGGATAPAASIPLTRTDPRHLGVGGPGDPGTPGVQEFSGSIRNDGNQVDLESEMSALAKTQLQFSTVGRLMSGRLAMLNVVINGGH